MARDRGAILFSLWGDDDWRELSESAQHLYMRLLSSPKLTYAGTVEFDASKESGFSRTSTPEGRYDAAAELAEAFFIVWDEDTSEVLVRSFLRHDGLLKKPNVTIAMTKAHAEIGSPLLRGVVVHELRRLKIEFPDWPAWTHASCAEGVARILKGRSIDPKRISSVQGSPNPSGKGSPKGFEVDGQRDPALPLPLQLPLPPSNEGDEPSLFCKLHWLGPSSTPCRECGDARRVHDAWLRKRKTSPGIVTDADCDVHLGYPKRGCPRCAEEAVAS